MIPDMRRLLEPLRSERGDEAPDAPVMRVRECQKAIDRAARVVGMSRITHHDLRHLFATRSIEAGVDIPTVSRWLGHKDGGALAMKVYGHLRNHSFENKATIESFPVRPDAEIQPRDGMIHWPVPRNHFEISLVEKLVKCLPVFAIESPDDVTLGAAKRVLVERQDWFDLVSKLIPHAHCLIVNYEQSTAGIERELECITANGVQDRVLVFVKESCLAEMKDKHPAFLEGIRRIVLKKEHSINDRLEEAEIPEDVLFDLVRNGNKHGGRKFPHEDSRGQCIYL